MGHLTAEQVHFFISNKLKFENWKEVLTKDRLHFLQEVVRKYVCNNYFQNITMNNKEVERRRRPTLEDVIQNGLAGNGGLCLQLNFFMKLLLQTLDFDVWTICGQVAASKTIKSHCLTIVRMGENELYLVDVGAGLPNYELVPLHNLPYRGMAGGYPYEFRRNDEGIFQRFQQKGSFFKGDFEDDAREELRYSFDLTAKEFNYFDPLMDQIFTDANISFFLRNTFLFRHMENNGDSASMQFVIVWGTSFVVGDAQSRTVTQCENYDQLKPYLYTYFPTLPNDEVEKAMKYFEQFETTASKYA